MRNGKRLLELSKQMEEDTPLSMLAASFTSTWSGKLDTYTVKVRPDYVAIVRNDDERQIYSRNASVADVPDSTMKELMTQFAEEKQYMGEFYRTALEKLSSAMVLDALTGKDIDLKGEFIRRMGELLDQLGNPFRSIRASFPPYMELEDQYIVTLENGCSGRLILNMAGAGSNQYGKRIIFWHGDLALMYLKAPEVIQQVDKWRAMCEKLTR